MKIAEAYVELRLDSKRARADGKAEVTSMSNELGSTFGKIFGAAAFAGGISKSIGAASDLNEQVARSKNVFGDAESTVARFAETAAQKMGMSKEAYREATSTLGGLLQNLGFARDASLKWSTDLTQLGADLGSAFNKDPARAVEAIGAALRGESEPIRAFNVQIDDARLKQKALELGLYDGVGALDANAKAQATLQLILEQTKTAQGDFAETADGAANAQRRAKAEAENSAASLGSNFLPIYERVVDVVGDVANMFGELPGPVQTALVALVGVVALSGPIGNVVDVVKSAGTAIKSLGASSLSAGPIIAGLATAGLLAYEMYQSFNEESDRAEQLQRDFYASVQAGLKTLDLQEVALLDAASAFKKYNDAVLADADEKVRQTVRDHEDWVDVLGQLGLSMEDVIVVNRGGAASFDMLAEARQHAIELGLIQIQLDGKSVDSADEVAAAWIRTGESVDYVTRDGHQFKVDVTDAIDGSTALINHLEDLAGATKDTAAAKADLVRIGDQEAYVFLKATGQLDLLTEAEVATAEAALDAAAAAEAQAKATEQATPVIEAATIAIDRSTDASEHKALASYTAARAEKEAAAADDARKSAVERLSKSVDGQVTKYDALAEAANDLKSALDSVFGGTMTMEGAKRAYAAGVDELTAKIKTNGATLDLSTEKGRDNRATIEGQVKTILDYGAAVVGAGGSLDDATASVTMMTDGLRAQLEQAGLTKEQIDEYLTTLGLTPENVTTAIELVNDEATKERLQGILEQMAGIDAGAAAEVQALIDQGAFDEAERLLAYLARGRPISMWPAVQTGNYTGPKAQGLADGGKVPGGSNTPAFVGDQLADELVLNVERMPAL